MLTKSILLATLAALAAANPIARRSGPETSRSRGWKLIANVTESPITGFGAEINHFQVTGIHIGPPYNRAVLYEQYEGGGSRIFYTNGSTEQGGTSQVLTDSNGFSPHFHMQRPDEFDLPANEKSHATFLQPGPDAGDDVVLEGKKLVSRFGAGKFVACKHWVQYYQSLWNVVDYVYEGEETPEGCVDINLLAQCDELKPIEENTEWNWFSHAHVVEEECYVDVAGADWSL
ncbi:hypothetical protein MCOR28_008530 [Pyricularia oryzae]|nr:hypothetical protein MCOR26_001879 [Pyricularia oryzae]KAI6337449.1 hypothetical protein MCOR28_008530 [Pyricularia oryzae]